MLDPDEPVTIGAMVGPEAFTEVKYLAHVKQTQALESIPRLAGELSQVLGRDHVGLLRDYRLQDAETIVVALGSVLGTIEDAIDTMRDEGVAIGALGIKAFRPFPLQEVRDVLGGARRVVVVERALAVGVGGIVSQDIQVALAGTGARVHTVVAGLGGRSITASSLREMLGKAVSDELEPFTFLDLDEELVDRELARTRERRRSGPHAENILRDVGVIAAGPI